MSNTQLVSFLDYDTSRMIFSEPIQGSIPDSKPAITFSRVNISTKYDDGTIGDLIFSTEECYCFGVSENTNQETGKVNGFVMPIVLFNKNGATENEKAFVDTFNNVVERCKDYLLENKEKIGQYDLERNDLKKLNPLYYKKDKGKVVEGASPVLYGKLIVSKKNGDKIISVIFNKDSGETINALDLLGKHCYIKAAIKIESVFIGNKISLQVKLYECQITPIDKGFKRLLPRPKSDPVVKFENNETKKSISIDDLPDDDEFIDAEEEVKPKIIKKVIKKVVKTDK
jgi:hypothetical protein